MAEAQFRGGPHTIASGRLTLETGVPISTSDQADATTLYYTPYIGNQLAIFDGTNWVVHQFAEISLSLSGLTASTPYDIFAEISSNAVALASVAWSNDTTRDTALTTQDGVQVLTGTLTRRYLGSIYIDATGGETNDTLALRHVWNYYNRVNRPMRVLETTDTWMGGSADAWRAMNNSAANALDFLLGVEEDGIEATVSGTIAANVIGRMSIGLDSSSTPATGASIMQNQGNLAATTMVATYRGHPGLGQHQLVALENDNTGGQTWYGDTGDGGVALQSGIWGSVLA